MQHERGRIEALEAENAALIHDLERQMTIANVECNRAEEAESALASERAFRQRDKAEIAELRANVDELTNGTDNGALCLEINDLTNKLSSALSEVGGLRRALASVGGGLDAGGQSGPPEGGGSDCISERT